MLYCVQYCALDVTAGTCSFGFMISARLCALCLFRGCYVSGCLICVHSVSLYLYDKCVTCLDF